MSKETGGPAFPTEAYDRKRQTMVREEGMSLRDYFAAKAMAADMATSYHPAKDIAKLAYQMADAMLAAREEG